jgi:hypothetical protein
MFLVAPDVRVQPDRRLFFAGNSLYRYDIGDRTCGLTRNDDGSLETLVAKETTGESPIANWLPIPSSGRMLLTWRLYQPCAELLVGSFSFPALERLD